MRTRRDLKQRVAGVRSWMALAHVAIPATLRGVHREDDTFALAGVGVSRFWVFF